MSEKLNPQIKPTALENVSLLELVHVARTCYQRGWAAGTAGNFSISHRPSIMWISQSGVCKGQLNPERFIPLDIRAKLATIEALYRKPSDESALHAAILTQVDYARAVVHVHPSSVVAMSMRPGGVRFTGLEMQKALGCTTHDTELVCPQIDNSQDIATLAQSIVIDAKVPVLILRGHGVYAWGRDPQQALNFVEGLEHLCQTALLVQ